MKRFLALLLTLVMLVSVCGLTVTRLRTPATSWSSTRAPAQRGHFMSATLFRIPTGSG